MNDKNLPAVRASRELATNERIAELAKRATESAESARARATDRQYRGCWERWLEWCREHEFASMPAAIGSVCLYMQHMFDEGRAMVTIQQALSAIKAEHERRRQRPIPMNSEDRWSDPWKDPTLKQLLRGISRKIAERRQIKQARPLTDRDVREILDMVDPAMFRQSRDAAIITCLFAGCRRRSEVVGLDYETLGTEPDIKRYGTLSVTQDGIVIRLMRSKTNQASATAESEVYMIKAVDAGRSVKAIAHWVKISGIKRGSPVFRGIKTDRPNGGKFGGEVPLDVAKPEVMPGRLDDKEVSRIIKLRMYQVLVKRELEENGRKKLTKAERVRLKALADEYSGHSGRRGSIQAAFERGVDRHHVRAQSGHKEGSRMLDLYSKDPEVKKNKFLVGSGL